MANKQTTRDRLAEALVKSVIDFLNADLVAAWGGAVEIVMGHPDLDLDARPLPTGAKEKRDLNVKPLVVVNLMEEMTTPWAISPSGDEVERTYTLKFDLMAKAAMEVKNLNGTLGAVLDGATGSTGGFPLKHPDTNATLGTVYWDGRGRFDSIFAGPGDRAGLVGDTPSSHAQFENMKHRAHMLAPICIRKPRGTTVI